MEDAKKYIYYIYKLCYEDKQNNLSYCYVGSTNNINNRHRQHQQSLNNPTDKEYNTLKYETIRKYPNLFEMIVIHKTTEPITRREAQILEEQYRINLNTNLNEYCCYINKNEYDKKHRQQHKEHYKQYRQQHKAEKRLYDMNYRQEQREKYLASKRAYYQKNKATYNDYKKN